MSQAGPQQPGSSNLAAQPCQQLKPHVVAAESYRGLIDSDRTAEEQGG